MTVAEINCNCAVGLIGGDDVGRPAVAKWCGDYGARHFSGGKIGACGNSGHGVAKIRGKQRKGDGKMIAKKKCGRLAVLRAQQQALRGFDGAVGLRKICLRVGESGKKDGTAAAECDERGQKSAKSAAT